MRIFNNIPITKKITGIVLLTSTAVLTLASTVFIISQIVSFRNMVIQELVASGNIVASHSTAALVFDDRRAAREMLLAFERSTNISSAAIYDQNGNLFAQYVAPGKGVSMPPLTSPNAADGVDEAVTTSRIVWRIRPNWLEGEITLVGPVILDQAQIGSLEIRANLDDVYRVVSDFIAIVAAVIFLSFSVALFMSTRLQKVVTQPIFGLLHTMHLVAQQHDYSQRAAKHGNDELGLLTDGFNNMLQTIELAGYYEPLSGLPNMPALVKDLTGELARRAEAESARLSLVTLSIRPLTEVDVTLGYANGDKVVREVAERMTRIFNAEGAVYHVARDRFAILLPDADYEHTVAATESGLQELHEPITVEGVPVRVGGHAGIAQYPTHGEDAETLVRITGLAVGLAERSGRSYAIYDHRQDRAQKESLLALMALREALLADQLTFHFQPKVNLTTGHCTGAEALIRWADAEVGFRAPGAFIPLAEQTGLIVDISQWAMKAAMQQLVKWRDTQLNLNLSVNLSVRDLEDPTLVERLSGLLQYHNVDPDRLEVEVTESAVMENPEEARDVLHRIRDLGVGVAIDDFGVGQSSLSYLKDLPVSNLKLDRSFLRNLISEPRQMKLVRATIEMAHELDLEVVAEGVENEAIYERLVAYGCDYAQGYFLSHALPETELRQWLEQSSWSVAPCRQATPRAADTSVDTAVAGEGPVSAGETAAPSVQN